MGTDPLQIPFDTIDTPQTLPALLDGLDTAQTVAIDTEANSFHHFHHKICLIQLAVPGQCFVVDPLAGLDLSQMLAILSRKRLIFHDAGYDLRLMLADFDFRPDGEIFDTMLAARLIGLENVSLSALLEQILGLRMSKQNQRANWAKRPLSRTLLAYAVEDIRYLGRLADYLAGKLNELGRTDWHREYCQWTIAQSQIPKTPEDPDRIWRIRGTSGLSPRQLAFVRAIWHWRQHESERVDLSPFRIFRNDQILDLAQWAQRQKRIDAEHLPRLPRHCRDNRLRALVEALQEASTLGPDQWPQPLPRQTNNRPSAEVIEKTDILRVECRRIAESLGLPPSLIASRKSLQAAVNTAADTEEKLLNIGWMRWQIRLILPSLRHVLGRSAE